MCAQVEIIQINTTIQSVLPAAFLQYVCIESNAVIVSGNLQNLHPHSIPASSLCCIKEREWKGESEMESEKTERENPPFGGVLFLLLSAEMLHPATKHSVFLPACLTPMCEYESLSQRDRFGSPPQCSAGSARRGMWSVSDSFLPLLDFLPFRSFAATQILMPHNTCNVFCMLLCTEVQCEGKTMLRVWTFVCTVRVRVSHGAVRLCHVAAQVVVASVNCHTGIFFCQAWQRRLIFT